MAEGFSLDISIHSHCKTCFRRNCTTFADNTECCEMMDCKEECGARFHGCKQLDHSMVCPNAKIHCANYEIGCPITLARYKLGSHLETCPASVVYCTMEWNRWPLYSKEKQSREVSMPFLNQEQSEQLDVALALRDQRMLNESFKMPRKVHRALRNSLTRRYPAVPFKPRSSTFEPEATMASNDTSATISDDGSDAPWETWKSPPGLQRSICNKLFPDSNLTGLSTSGVDTQLPDIPESDTPSPTVSEGGSIIVNVQESYDNTKKTDIGVSTRDFFNIDEAVQTNEKHSSIKPNPPPTLNPVRLSLDLTLESVARYQPKPKSMYTFLCAQDFRRDEYCSHFKNIHGEIHPGLNGWMEERCPLAQYGCPYSYRRFCPTDKGYYLVHSSVNESFGVKAPVPNIQYTTSSSIKSCPEIMSCDTQKQDNYSCHDNERETTSYYSNQQSNTIISEQEQDLNCDILLNLPFEILQHIARCLDSFSICHLSVTSKRLREVCCSLLEERGIVVLQWEKNTARTGIQPLWDVAFKRWCFSSAFTPVSKWCFTEHDHMSEHLKVCSYNVKNSRTEKFRLEGLVHSRFRKVVEDKTSNGMVGGTSF